MVNVIAAATSDTTAVVRTDRHKTSQHKGPNMDLTVVNTQTHVMNATCCVY